MTAASFILESASRVALKWMPFPVLSISNRMMGTTFDVGLGLMPTPDDVKVSVYNVVGAALCTNQLLFRKLGFFPVGCQLTVSILKEECTYTYMLTSCRVPALKQEPEGRRFPPSCNCPLKQQSMRGTA